MSPRRHIGYFITSIDFELIWGVLDNPNIKSYRDNLVNGRNSIDRLLVLFDKYSIHATFATVGLLFNKNKKGLQDNTPKYKAKYSFENSSPYVGAIEIAGENEKEDRLHFGLSIINMLNNTKGIEIGSHTYSHYYTEDDGHDSESFTEDLELFKSVSSKININPKSIVFPRNQINANYLKTCFNKGYTSYRGNENSWIYRKGNNQKTSLFTRTIRILDAYINISGYNTYGIPHSEKNAMVNLPSSRFFRPIKIGPGMPGAKTLSKLKVNRVKKAMTYAAKNKEIFHLWWHPHNFGKNTDMIFGELTEILKHYSFLNKKYGMSSMNMNDITEKINNA